MIDAHRGSFWKCPGCQPIRTVLLAGFWIAVVLVTLALTGCSQAFVEVRHDRPARVDARPDTVLSIGARWYFWDAYGDWLAQKIREAK